MKVRKTLNTEDSKEAIKIALIADSLAHPLRVSLLNYVRKKNKVRNDICNKDLVEHFPYSQSSLSQHIKKLREAGLFTVEYRDKYSFYSVNEKTINDFILALKEF